MSNLQKRREQEKQVRQDAILDAAEKMFGEKGYDRTSMDDIARTASLSRALLYVYFKDKAAIQRGIILRAAERLRERFSEALDSEQLGLQKIKAIGQAYYHFWQEEPDYFEALTKAPTAMQEADDDEAQVMIDRELENMQLMVKALEEGLKDGSIGGKQVKDPFQTALYLRGALHGVIMMCQHEAGMDRSLAKYPGDALIKHTIAMLVRSLQA
jgi:AcrR family transcriptional regulator